MEDLIFILTIGFIFLWFIGMYIWQYRTYKIRDNYLKGCMMELKKK